MRNLAWPLILFCFSCTKRQGMPSVNISMIDNRHSVKVKGLDYAIISEINRDSIPDVWQSLILVYRMPPDTDLKNYQVAQPGVYKIIDSAVVFTPDTPFANNKTYFMRYYQFDDDGNVMDYITGKKKLRKNRYVDLIFK